MHFYAYLITFKHYSFCCNVEIWIIYISSTFSLVIHELVLFSLKFYKPHTTYVCNYLTSATYDMLCYTNGKSEIIKTHRIKLSHFYLKHFLHKMVQQKRKPSLVRDFDCSALALDFIFQNYKTNLQLKTVKFKVTAIHVFFIWQGLRKHTRPKVMMQFCQAVFFCEFCYDLMKHEKSR